MTKTKNKLLLVLIAFLTLCITAFGMIFVTPASADAKPADVKLNVGKTTTILGSDFYTTTETVDNKTFTAYGVMGGGFVQLFTLDKTYDVTKISNTNKGALTFYLYIGSEHCLERHQSLSGSWNVDLCSSKEYDDAYKYSFNIADLFKDCEVGWNKIELPVLTALEKKDIDFATIRYIRLNCDGLLLTNSDDCNFKFGDFTFTTTDKTVGNATPCVKKSQDVGSSVSAWFRDNTGVKVMGCVAAVLLIALVIVSVKRGRR